MTSATPRDPSMSLKAAGAAIAVAFLAGLILSLAVRPRTRVVTPDGETVKSRPSSEAGQTTEALSWRVPIAFKSNLPALGDNIIYVTETLGRISGGAIEWKFFEPGEVVPALGITDAVKENKIEAGYTWLGYDQGKIPASPLLSAVPFGMEPWEFAAWWFEDEGEKLAEELYEPHDQHPILCGVIGPETAGWFRDEINSVEDFSGLNIRFAGLGGRVLEKLGASVSVLPGGEIFGALEKGTIDASEFSMPAIDQKLAFDKVVKRNYFPGWHQTYTAFHLVVNKAVWDGLQESTRGLIETTCTAGVIRNLARGEAVQGEVIAKFPERGVTAGRLPVELLRELQSVTHQVLEEEAAKDPLFKKIYESQRRFSATYKNWKSLAYLPRDF